MRRGGWVCAVLVVFAGVALGAAGEGEDLGGQAWVRWLDADVPGHQVGTAWGVPWPRGSLQADEPLTLQDGDSRAVPVQTWPLAYWPDGSIKWTGHAVAAVPEAGGDLRLTRGAPAVPEQAVTVRRADGGLLVDTGVIQCRLEGGGDVLIQEISRDGTVLARAGRLVCLREDRSRWESEGTLSRERFVGVVDEMTVEQDGPVRAVVKIDGRHRGENGREWLPFSVRLYFHAGADSVRIMHTFIYDGDHKQDFIAGLGMEFGVPLRDEMHDRHVRFAGPDDGVWGEAVRHVSGLRRNPGDEVKANQWAGEATPPVDTWADRVQRGIHFIPLWDEYSLTQATPDSFKIRKRTGRDVTWLEAGYGGRASGAGYVGGPSGGIAFGIRDFWQQYPSQLDIVGAATDEALVSMWLWAPNAPPMDMRSYEIKVGQDTHEQQLAALDITYEDYEHGFDTPYGVARTSEMTLWAAAATPPREAFAEFAAYVREPPQLLCRPERYVAIPLFGGMWSLPDRSTPVRARIEDHLDAVEAYYRDEVDQRRWYGFWHYGDIMHTYDEDRHVWRYDVGGYAWDNSELSPDLWLWYSFLRSGRAETFRFAEAMTRHTGEVDVYHLGRFAGLGSRHNILHWGCSAKQVRVSLAAFRRIFYYLTADERTGDLMREVADSDQAVLNLNPVRKLPNQADNPYPATVGIGPDWYALAGNWLTEWERTGNEVYRDKILAGMHSIGAMPFGMFSGVMVGYDPETSTLHHLSGDAKAVSHLSAVFGGVEICAELIDLLDVPAFEEAWLQYCRLYNASREEREAATGEAFAGGGLPQAHSRITAYAARHDQDPALADRAWREFFTRGWVPGWNLRTLNTDRVRVDGPAVLEPIEEIPWMTTNDAAQWGLAAIQNLALIGDDLPETIPDEP